MRAIVEKDVGATGFGAISLESCLDVTSYPFGSDGAPILCCYVPEDGCEPENAGCAKNVWATSSVRWTEESWKDPGSVVDGLLAGREFAADAGRRTEEQLWVGLSVVAHQMASLDNLLGNLWMALDVVADKEEGSLYRVSV